jgi:predicted nuclease of restriction endonuclease-like RecB superfamily
MLTADLVLATIRDGRIRPRYLDTTKVEWRDRADALAATFASATGHQRHEIDDALDDIVVEDRNSLAMRGMIKLLDDASSWESATDVDPVELRRAVFERGAELRRLAGASARGHFSREEAIADVAQTFGLSPEKLEAALYADLRSEERLVRCDLRDPDELLARYNLSLAQGVLLRAREVRLVVRAERPAKIRELFAAIKFRQLLHRATPTAHGGWSIVLDGPASILRQSQRYGVQMAMVLPSIPLVDHWELQADVQWTPGERPLLFEASSADGLVTHRRSRGTWVSDEERVLVERIEKAGGPWKVSRSTAIVDLGGEGVLVPDLIVEHKEDGRRAFVEIVGHWRRGWLESRLALLKRRAPSNLVLCVSKRLGLEDETLENIDGIVQFAEVITLGRFMEAVERVATTLPKKRQSPPT